MKNAEWMIKNNIDFRGIKVDTKIGGYDFDYAISIDGVVLDVMHFRTPHTAEQCLEEWLDCQHKEPILDDVEKRYLKGFIRPFRDRVQSISKEGNSIVEWLSFKLVNNAPFELPFFKSGRMYKNMERGKEYTLDELGL